MGGYGQGGNLGAWDFRGMGRGPAGASGETPGDVPVIMNFQSPQGAIDAAVTVPTQEDGTVLFDMPLSSPSEEVRLARQLEYHQWPDHLELECSELVDFDLGSGGNAGNPELTVRFPVLFDIIVDPGLFLRIPAGKISGLHRLFILSHIQHDSPVIRFSVDPR